MWQIFCILINIYMTKRRLWITEAKLSFLFANKNRVSDIYISYLAYNNRGGFFIQLQYYGFLSFRNRRIPNFCNRPRCGLAIWGVTNFLRGYDNDNLGVNYNDKNNCQWDWKNCLFYYLLCLKYHIFMQKYRLNKPTSFIKKNI